MSSRVFSREFPHPNQLVTTFEQEGDHIVRIPMIAQSGGTRE